MNTIIAFLLVLGPLIFFHELGHFIVARFFGVGVEKFSLGFGPRLFGKKVGRTDYRVSAIPLGGYVKMVGEEPDADVSPEDIRVSFTHKPVLQRILIVAAGPLFNVLLAILLFYLIFIFSGTYILKPTIGKVGENTPAQQAGLQAGDLVVAIDDQPVETWYDMADLISASKGNRLTLTVDRDGLLLNLELRPALKTLKNDFGEETERYVIGIEAARELTHKKLGSIEAAKEAFVQSYKATEMTIVVVGKIFQGKVSPKTLGGPIMIAHMAGEQAKAGIVNLVFLIALISINLAILNILPIPVLDGGHLLFFTIELLIGRPVNMRAREIAQQAGLFILLLLMAYVFYNDILRWFAGDPTGLGSLSGK